MHIRIIIEKDFWDIISSLGILIVGGITAHIAYKQHKTEKDKAKLDVYDKRFAVYKAIMEIFSNIMKNANVSSTELFEYTVQTREVYFLFDSDVAEKVEEIRKKAIDLQLVETLLSDRNLDVGEKRSDLAKQSHDLLVWFGEQPDEIKKIFAKYLSISNL